MKERVLEKTLTEEEIVTIIDFNREEHGDFFNHCIYCGFVFDKGYNVKLLDLETTTGEKHIPLSPVKDYGFDISSGVCGDCKNEHLEYFDRK